MAIDFVKWRNYLKPGEQKVVRDRVSCKPKANSCGIIPERVKNSGDMDFQRQQKEAENRSA